MSGYRPKRHRPALPVLREDFEPIPETVYGVVSTPSTAVGTLHADDFRRYQEALS